jgi:hypothetical protein
VTIETGQHETPAFPTPERPRAASPQKAARPKPATAEIIRRFTRGKEHPRGVVWFGARSFWGHLAHLVSAAIASENIDARAWMTPDDPQELLARIARVLGGNPDAGTLVESLGRDVYVDWVADTGDDLAVSRAVGALIFAPYELPDPDRPGEVLLAPRGDILLCGGDMAYPVSTAKELLNRVIVPWNQVLQGLPPDGRPRVLLGVSGNHDWYDGLDGFNRMFRRRPPDDEVRPKTVVTSPKMLEHYAAWAREFVRGGTVDKPALALSGYTPVQNGSYFALSLASNLELLGVDRQLTDVDERQKRFLGDRYHDRSDAATIVVLHDPVYLFGDPHKAGTQMVKSLQLDLEGRETLVLTGDIHHYERLERGKAVHVISGAGGAFLHPARLAKGGLRPTKVWPGVAQCKHMLRSVPLKLALGRSGFLPHVSLLVLYALPILFNSIFLSRLGLLISAPVLTTLILWVIYALIGGAQRKGMALKVLPISFGGALLTALMPVGASYLVGFVLQPLSAFPRLVALAALVVTAFLGTFVFGAYLSLLTLLGYEHMQAFTVLDHPGFKQFVRLRIRADGQGIDVWAIGAADPLGERGEPVLVDHFTWRPFRERKATLH